MQVFFIILSVITIILIAVSIVYYLKVKKYEKIIQDALLEIQLKDKSGLAIKDWIVMMKNELEQRDREIFSLKQISGKNTSAKISAITEIAKQINKSLDLNIILNEALEKVMDVTEVEAGVILLMDDEIRNLNPVAFRGVSDELVDELKNSKLRLDEGTRGEVINSGKTVLAGKSRSSHFTGRLVQKISLKSMASIPLKAKDKVIGLLDVGSRSAEKFSQEDLELLNAIGSEIGIAIQNAKLYSLVKDQVQELENKNHQLMELEIMKENLTQMIVHDLKNPLTGIMGYTQLLFMESEFLKAEQIHAVKMIYSSSKNLMTMITNLLDISRIEENKVQLSISEILIGEVIEQNLDEARSVALKENIELVKAIEDNLPAISVDRDFICRVVANLLNNALKYSPPDSKITVGAKTDNNNLIVFVTDTGEGIPKEYQEKIFEKFIQVGDAKSKGMRVSKGLGLTFCKMAIEVHGGKIWVESEINERSTFYFSLPLTREI